MSARKLLFCAGLVACLQADPGIADVRAVCGSSGADHPTLNVYFHLPAPAAAAVVDAGNWRIRYFYPAGTPALTPELAISIGTAALASSGRVDLPLIGAVPSGATSVLVQYSGPDAGSSWSAKLPCPASSSAAAPYQAAAGRDDADIYVSGGYSPATATTPLFSADVNLGLRSQITGAASWQAVGSLKTDDRPKADPDSFRFRGAWVYDWPTTLAWSANLGGGMEFDRHGRARNVVASPRLSFVPLAGVRTSAGKLLAAAALEIRGGIETGRNTTPTFRFSNSNFEGTKGIFRGVPGATFYLNLFDPAIFGVRFKKISVASSYDVRLLTRPEIFLETRTAAQDPVPQLRSQPRNKTETGIAFKLTDAWGFSLKYEHGSLPPAFVYVRNKLTLGILLQLKESRGLRP